MTTQSDGFKDMEGASAYRSIDVLYQGQRVSVYRAVRLSDGLQVVLKRLERPREGFSDVARLCREFEIARRLNGPGVVGVLAIETSRDGAELVMRDTGGVSVAVARQIRPPTLDETLRIGLAVAGALDRVHAGHVIHKDINPANIVWNRQTGAVELIDFSISAELARETSPSDIHQIEGTLPYLAPEQTGRVNRTLDWRCDFYALGATLYDLLTGRVPFEGDDALAIIHGHIARAPVPPHQINPAIPPVVSAIVLKLMAKEPEHRYQSTHGIIGDLETCLAAGPAPARGIPDFVVGAKDFSPHFQVPEKLYGREGDVTRLIESFEKVAFGATRLLLVTGAPGIGKSALVQEVQKPLTAGRGLFVQGKYDQFKRNIPYSGLVQAFRLLIRSLLAEPERELSKRRRRLQNAIGANGAVVTELIPEFELVLGPQSPIRALPPAESEFRFQMTFQNLVIALVADGQPLVLALDDLQWADRSSLALLSRLISDPEMHHLLVIGTLRDTDDANGSPLSNKALDSLIEVAEGRVEIITVDPLTLEDVNALVAETTRRQGVEVERLAASCQAKTQGNPFFLIQFLHALQDDGLITLNRADGGWTWDTEAIAGRDSTDNVVDLMVGKIRRLDQAATTALSLAACVGASFDLATLAVAAASPPGDLARALWPALTDGLIRPLTSGYRHLKSGYDRLQGGGLEGGSDIEPAKVRYRFLHDRVQQAAYSLIPERERAAAHLRIGRLLLAESGVAEREDRLFDIVDHLNRGGAMITDPVEDAAVAALNLEATERAKASAAFESALAYAEAGLVRLGDTPWGRDYPMALALHTEAAEAATMVGDFSAMENHARSVLAAARSPVDAAGVQMIRLTAAAGRGDPVTAAAIGLEALAALGVALPRAPSAGRLRWELWRGRWALARARLRRSGPPALLDTPTQAERRATTARLLMAMVATAIISARHLLVPIAVRLLELALPARDAGISSFATLSWALISARTGDLTNAVKYSRRALDLLDSDILKSRYVRVTLIAHYCGQHWALSPDALRAAYRDVFETALAAGDREYAVYGLAFRLRTGWQTGVALDRQKSDVTIASRILARLGTSPYHSYVAALRQALVNLESPTPQPARLDGNYFHEDEVIAALRAARNGIVLTNLWSIKLLLAVVFGDIEAARTIIEALKPDLAFLDGFSTQPVVIFLTAITDSAEPSSQPMARTLQAARLETAILWFRTCAAVGPTTQFHRLLLLEAEGLRLRDNVAEATVRYEQAVAAAGRAGHNAEMGLAAERAANFHRNLGHRTLERAYRAEARDAYRRWGAWAKVRQLEQRYVDLTPFDSGAPSESRATTTSSASVTTERITSGVLDFTAVLKAAQAISSEIRLEALLETMLRIVLHNAGAERGVLLLPRRDQSLVLVAESDASRDHFTPLADLAPDTPDEDGLPRLPMAVVNYVVRSGDAVVLGDATTDPHFADDPYIQGRKPRAVLCLPLLRRSHLVGVLYLENTLTTNAFAGERLEAPRLLAAQIAVSLENARLYDELNDFNRALEAQVAERTRELSCALASERMAHEERRTAQKQLVQAEKMASLGQLVAGMAHEINTPIGNALVSVTFLADAGARIVDSATKGTMRRSEFNAFIATLGETTEIMLSNIRRAADLVESFKTVTADRASDDYRTFDLKPYLREVIVSLEPTWRRAKHTVVLDCPEPLLLDGYPGAIAQIVSNLVVNSVTHGFPNGRTGGTLMLTVTAPDAATVIFDYTDDGVGIAPENRERIFDPFFTTRRGGGSTGLGLHIIFNLICSKLGGGIELRAPREQGIHFRVTLPRRIPKEP